MVNFLQPDMVHGGARPVFVRSVLIALGLLLSADSKDPSSPDLCPWGVEQMQRGRASWLRNLPVWRALNHPLRRADFVRQQAARKHFGLQVLKKERVVPFSVQPPAPV